MSLMQCRQVLSVSATWEALNKVAHGVFTALQADSLPAELSEKLDIYIHT